MRQPHDFAARRDRIMRRDGWKCAAHSPTAVRCNRPAVDVRRREPFGDFNDRNLIAVCDTHEWSDTP